MSNKEPIITFENVHKWYTPEFEVLKGIDYTFYKGEVTVIIGPSGSGKSTFIRTINGLEEHQEGVITVEGHVMGNNLKELNEIRKKCGFVFQSFNLFPHLTVMDNITLAQVWNLKRSKKEAKEKAYELLGRVGMAAHVDKYPLQLSGGEQQRVAIARSLAMDPEIMLFDEPTSALDPEMIKEVLDVMTELAQSNMTIICVTHEIRFAQAVSDNIIFFDKGKIVETAPPAQFFAHPQEERTKHFLSQILHQ
ncbi:MAG: amino acid ABC transporter ATP-binding protein [Spirochaetia bacterium]|jgi:general L-amino acid transport system ATP-binding protein|nr:amino acid ABC transporter ATP-binding protein [Spirochaetia bacterium]